MGWPKIWRWVFAWSVGLAVPGALSAKDSSRGMEEESQLRHRLAVIHRLGWHAPDEALVEQSCSDGSRQKRVFAFPSLSDLESPDEADSVMVRLFSSPDALGDSLGCMQNGGDWQRQVVYCRYLPGVALDMQLVLNLRQGHVVSRVYRRMNMTGELMPVELPASNSPDFHDGFRNSYARAFELRGVWLGMMTSNWRGSNMVAKLAEPGYVIVFRPYRSRGRDRDRLFEAFEPHLGELIEEMHIDIAEFLRYAGSKTPLAGGPSYRQWATFQAQAIGNESVDALALVNSSWFFRNFSAEAARMGMRLLRPQPGGFHWRLSRGPYRLEFDAYPMIMQTIHAGLSFGDGVARFAGPTLKRLEMAAILGDAIGKTVPHRAVGVEDGTVLAISSADGQRHRINLLSLVDIYDVNSSIGVMAALTAAGYDSVTGKFSVEIPHSDTLWCNEEGVWSLGLYPEWHLMGLKSHDARPLYPVVTERHDDDVAVVVRRCLHGHVEVAPQGRNGLTVDVVKQRVDGEVGRAPLVLITHSSDRVDGVQAVVVIGPGIGSAVLKAGWLRRLANETAFGQADVQGYAPFVNAVVLTQPRHFGFDRSAYRNAALNALYLSGYSGGANMDWRGTASSEETPQGTVYWIDASALRR